MRPTDGELPHSVAAEQAVLGGLLYDGNAWSKVSDIVLAADFYRPDHRVLFESFAALTAAGTKIDRVTVGEQLEREGKLRDIGGEIYLTTLEKDTTGVSNIRAYAEIVHERALQRRLIALGDKIQAAVREGEASTAIATALQRTLADFSARTNTVTASALSRVRSAAEITSGVLLPVRYLTQERIPKGLVLVAAPPKKKKSWLAIQAMMAAAQGSELLGQATEQGRALGLVLEDNDRRLAQRLEFLGVQSISADARGQMHFVYEWPKGNAGVAALREWLAQYPDTVLIVIDVLQKFRGDHDPRAGAYAGDYAALEGLHALTRDHPDLTVMVIHHVRKQKGDSPAETVSGTNGITGAVDAYIILETGTEPDTAKVHIDGRDWELWTHDFIWRFVDRVGWTHDKVITDEDSLTAVQRDWLLLVRQRGPLTPSAAASERVVSVAAASQMLSSLAKRGFLLNDRGTYSVRA